MTEDEANKTVTKEDRKLLNDLQKSKDIELTRDDAGNLQMYTLTDYGRRCIENLRFKWGMTKTTRD
jgi:DNA-binding PadR family transcriptional regulator